jgi:uncharacterized protein (TIGR02246 family)
MEPEGVVQEQVDALNARDLDRFVGCYSPDAVVVDGKGNVIYQGHDAIKGGYGEVFSRSPDVHIAIRTRFVVGSWVIDEVDGTGFNFGSGPVHLHEGAAYRVEDGKIVRCIFLA